MKYNVDDLKTTDEAKAVLREEYGETSRSREEIASPAIHMLHKLAAFGRVELSSSGKWCPAKPSAALISLHPEYAEAILTGGKWTEFRKRWTKKPEGQVGVDGQIFGGVNSIVIYRTKTRKAPGAVVGVCQVVSTDYAPPWDLWHHYKDSGGISREAFDDYFRSTRKAGREGVALKLGKVFELPEPVPLNALKHVKAAPQNFVYVLPDDLKTLWEVGA